ncbi:MAG: PAS domain S-box protein, partial [Nitrospirota bacterium]|nr:PAS domain S-box protein [Nitrospirota bacterium]
MAGVLNRRSFAIKALSVIVPVIAPLVFCSPAFCLQKTAKIGVLAYRGAAEALQMWSPTAAYLSAHVPNYHFSVIPLTFREIGPAVRNGEVDFVVANTSIYVELETQYGISRIATIKNKSRLGGFTVFGGVIFCRTDRRDIREIGDLKGRSFMAVDETSLGGWQAAWKELKGHGIEPHRDFKGLRFGDTHDAVVHAVLNGKVDAGTVRTDTLEHMAADGKIDLQAFRIINEQRVEGFPYALSTRLYPEWPFAKLRHADNELAQKVVIALLRLAPDSRAAKAAKIMGWTVPLDYEPVHELLKGLRMGPYKDYGKITLSAAIRHHWHWAALALLTVLLMAAATSYVFALNRRLALSQGRLEEAKNSLEREVRDRTAKLSESEERYRLIVDTSLEGIITIDPRGEIVLSNNRMAEMLGRTREELLGGLLVSFVHEDEALDHEKQHNLWLQGKTSYYERRFRKKDGTVTWTSATATPLFNQDGTLRGASGLFTDITERKKAEKDLQRERDRAERYLDIAGVMFATLNTEGEICLVNKKGCSILGYDDESELLGRDWFEVCLPGTVKDSVKGVFDQLMAGDVEPVEYYENPVVTKAGDERIIAFHNTVLYDPLSKRPSGILFSGEDITDRYKMDRALRETNEMLETLVRASPLAIVVFDGDGNVALWNPAAERIFGWNAQEVLGRFNPIVGEEKKQEFLALLDRVMHGESLSSVSLRRSKKDGSVIDVSVSSAPMRNAAHEPVGIISVIADITARKQAEAERENLIADIRSALDAVNRSKKEWQETFDSITDMISIHDRDYNVIKANKAFSANLGKTPQEVINRKCY